MQTISVENYSNRIFVRFNLILMDPILLVLLIVGFTIFMFAWEKIPIDITAMISMAMLLLSGLVTTKEGIAGFSNDATITILFLFLLSSAIENTGAINLMGRYMLKIAGRKPKVALLVVMLVSGAASAFLNNTAVIIILMPIVFKISRFNNISPTKLLMPMSFAAVVGGTCTVIGTSTNIIVSGISEAEGFGRFGMFEFTTIGLVLFAFYFVFMFFIGSRMLPARRSVDSLTENYELKDYLTEIVIEKDSRLIGKRFKQTVLIDDMHLEVIEITSHDGSIWLPDAYEILEAGDKLLVRGSRTDIAMIKAMKGVVFAPEELIEDLDLKSNETTLIEVVVAPNSSIARSSINEINFKDLYDAIPLALRRKGVLMNEKFSDMELRFGDDILLEVKKDSIDQLKRSYDFVFTQELDKVEFNPKKMYLSVAVLFGVILLAAFNILPIIVGALIGIIILVLADCITIREAYRQVDWKIIFVLACLIPLGTALTNSGAADQLAGSILDYLSDLGPLYILFFLFILTALTTSIMSNAATAVLLCPVAISLAAQMSLDPKPFLFTIMFAASTCYLTPVGYQGNILIYGPGNYKFADFVRVGGLFTVISMFVVVFMLYSIYV